MCCWETNEHTGKQELDRCWSGTGLESPVSDFALSLPAPADKNKDRDRDRDLKQNVRASMWCETTGPQGLTSDRQGRKKVGTHMTLMSNIAINYVVSAYARVCSCQRSNLLCCAWSLRMMLLGPQEGERFYPGVQGQAQHCQVCSSHVYPNASRMDALAL